MEHQEIVVTLVSGKGLRDELINSVKREVGATRAVGLAENEAVDLYCTASASINERVSSVIKGSLVDVFVQPIAARRKKLLIADMESTIIEQEMLDEMADILGIRAKVADITHRAMNGELDFAEALRERVALLRRQPLSLLTSVATRITPMPGAETLVATMKANGAKCWLASGGFSFFAEVVARRLGFDAFFSNELVIHDGTITGELESPIFDKKGKATLIQKANNDLGIQPDEIVAVGDGANDVPMLSECAKGGGLGVAYYAKPKVRDVIGSQINHNDLTALLYAQGYAKTAFSTGV